MRYCAALLRRLCTATPVSGRFAFAAAVLASGWAAAENTDPAGSVPSQFNEATVAELQAKMAAGTLTSEQLTKYYLQRILALDQNGPGVNSVIELNPDAIRIAEQMDDLRMHGRVLGPLHGIPVLIKDNIDTGDRMQTTAGSLALVGRPALTDSTVAAKLRAGGAVIIGKTNLSEWANFRSFESISGWSGRGGQTNNPYGINRNPCGSSSGSGAAASANFAVLALGSETDGSIVCPSNANGLVGIKPTVGLTSRAGVVPISHTQDTVGPLARTVADAAAALGVIQSQTFDGRDPATGSVPLGLEGPSRPTNIPTDYTQFLNPKGLAGRPPGADARGAWRVRPAGSHAASGTGCIRGGGRGADRSGRNRHRFGRSGFHFPVCPRRVPGAGLRLPQRRQGVLRHSRRCTGGGRHAAKCHRLQQRARR